MKAIPHGSFSVNVENGLMHAAGKGPFNKELIIEYQSAVNLAVESLTGQKWGAVISLYGESLMTPEAEEQLVLAVKDRMERGMVATASVFLESSVVSLQYQQMKRIYLAAGVTFKLFEDEKEAMTWVRHHLKES